MDQHCVEIGRDPNDIERSSGAAPTKIAIGDELLASGATLITLGMDGDSGYDLAPVGEWLAWRDERNGGRFDLDCLRIGPVAKVRHRD